MIDQSIGSRLLFGICILILVVLFLSGCGIAPKVTPTPTATITLAPITPSVKVREQIRAIQSGTPTSRPTPTIHVDNLDAQRARQAEINAMRDLERR